jgi:hypothetical protein
MNESAFMTQSYVTEFSFIQRFHETVESLLARMSMCACEGLKVVVVFSTPRSMPPKNDSLATSPLNTKLVGAKGSSFVLC